MHTPASSGPARASDVRRQIHEGERDAGADRWEGAAVSSLALVLEENPTAAEEVRTILSRRGLRVLIAPSPAVAQRQLARHDFALAVIDGTPDAPRQEVLRQLARSHPHTLTVVRDDHVGDLPVAQAIHASHPAALTHDSRLGAPSLATRLGHLLAKEVGDLALEGGRVVHEPSGRSFGPAVGAQLMLAHPRWMRVERTGAGSVGISRMRRWLVEVGSCVSLVGRGRDSHYRLEADAVQQADLEMAA